MSRPKNGHQPGLLQHHPLGLHALVPPGGPTPYRLYHGLHGVRPGRVPAAQQREDVVEHLTAVVKFLSHIGHWSALNVAGRRHANLIRQSLPVFSPFVTATFMCDTLGRCRGVVRLCAHELTTIGHMQQIDAGHHLEQLARQVRRRAGAERAHADRARLCLGERDQLAYAAELVGMTPDVILCSGSGSLAGLLRTTRT
jgi:hypothetical protein